MADEEPKDVTDTAKLKQRQRKQEQLEREHLCDAGTEAEAERHRRRADKARYLVEKLEERDRSEHDVSSGED